MRLKLNRREECALGKVLRRLSDGIRKKKQSYRSKLQSAT